MRQRGENHLCAVQGVKVKAHLICRVHCLDGEVVLGEVSICDGVEQVMRGMAVAHLELPSRLGLIISHELHACRYRDAYASI